MGCSVSQFCVCTARQFRESWVLDLLLGGPFNSNGWKDERTYGWRWTLCRDGKLNRMLHLWQNEGNGMDGQIKVRRPAPRVVNLHPPRLRSYGSLLPRSLAFSRSSKAAQVVHPSYSIPSPISVPSPPLFHPLSTPVCVRYRIEHTPEAAPPTPMAFYVHPFLPC